MISLLAAILLQTSPSLPPLPQGWSERELFALKGGRGGFGFADRLEARFWRRSPYPAARGAPAAYWVAHVVRRHDGLPGQTDQSFDAWLDESDCPQLRRAVERIAAFRPPPPYASDSQEQGLVIGAHGTNYTLTTWGGRDAIHQAQVTTFDPNGGLLGDLTSAVQDDLLACL